LGGKYEIGKKEKMEKTENKRTEERLRKIEVKRAK
jgi:hypothetical protein